VKKLRFIPYKAEHAYQIERKPEDRQLCENEKYYLWAKSNEVSGPGATCLYKDVIICSFGIRIFWEGAGEIWGIFCRDIRKYIGVHRHIRDYLEETIDECKLDRVQARTRADSAEGNRYLNWLGFEKECLLQKFGPDGHDYNSYVRLR
jgi:hypothetical protein